MRREQSIQLGRDNVSEDRSGRDTRGHKKCSIFIISYPLLCHYERQKGGIGSEVKARLVSKLCIHHLSKPPLAFAVRQRGMCTNLMEVMRLLMESETVREWPASIDQVGGSLGLSTSERAVSRR